MTTKAKPSRSRLDPEPAPRRDMLGLSALWTMGAALLFGLAGMLKLPKAAVLASPSKKFRVALPEALPPGEAFIPPGRAVARAAGGARGGTRLRRCACRQRRLCRRPRSGHRSRRSPRSS